MTPDAPPDEAVGLQGCYAGVVSRVVAFAVDLLLSLGLITIALSVYSYAVNIVSGRSVEWKQHRVVAFVIVGIWEFVYFAYPWSASGKTPGMALLGLRVVRGDGTPARALKAVVRTLTLPLSIAFFYVGLAFVLLQRERRAVHDLIAGTAVVYDWDARAAHLRFLARRAESAERQGDPILAVPAGDRTPVENVPTTT